MADNNCNRNSYDALQQYREAEEGDRKIRLAIVLQEIAFSRGCEINRLRKLIVQMAKTEDYEACKAILMKELIVMIEDPLCKVDGLR